MRRLLLLVGFASVAQVAFADACSEAYSDRSANEQLQQCRRSAESGEAEAQFGYGLVLWSGVGRTPNQPEALEWLRRSARQANLLARVSLGRFLSSDELDPQLRNLPEGYAWWMVAGQTDAANSLKTRLSSVELSTAEKLVGEYRTKYGASR